jgi:hypothetical protein
VLTVVFGSLLAAADDLDAAVDGVSGGMLDPGACGGLGGIEAAWTTCAHAWIDGVEVLTRTPRDLAETVRRVAAIARSSDEDAARLIRSVLS